MISSITRLMYSVISACINPPEAYVSERYSHGFWVLTSVMKNAIVSLIIGEKHIERGHMSL